MAARAGHTELGAVHREDHPLTVGRLERGSEVDGHGQRGNCFTRIRLFKACTGWMVARRLVLILVKCIPSLFS